MTNSGLFIISLDFELHWGGFEKWPLNEGYKAYFNKTRESIPEVLSLFQQSGLHATWATVGLLMHKNRSELEVSLPTLTPTYAIENLSAYKYIHEYGIGANELEDPFHFAGSLVDQILNTSGQEIGTHTFAHYYCNEEGQTPVQFKDDLKAAKKAASSCGITLKSLVFPRNQYNASYLEVCAAEGIKVVRVNPLDWWWQINSTQNESKWKRLNRGADAYISIGGKTTYSIHDIKKEKNVFLLPASRLLRPYRPKELFLNKWKIERIKTEMTAAAKNNEIYHLWWHPHNFGRYTEQNLSGLVDIANHFQVLHQRHGMVSMNMGEIADLLTYGKKS